MVDSLSTSSFDRAKTWNWLVCGLAFAIGAFVIDRSIGWGLQAAFAHIDTGEACGQINAALKSPARSIVILGSSLARHQVDPRIISKSLHHEVFNAGCNGQGIYYTRLLTSVLLEREESERPTAFVYVVNWADLLTDDRERSRMFSAYAGNSPAVASILVQENWLERIKLMSHAYRFNSLGLSIARQYVRADEPGIDGFHPLQRDFQSHIPDVRMFDLDRRGRLAVDTATWNRKLAEHEQFILTARQHGVSVMFVVPPTFRHGQAIGPFESRALAALADLAHKHDVPFVRLDETVLTELRDASFYGDERHLNASGAERFSREVANRLKLLMRVESNSASSRPSGDEPPRTSNKARVNLQRWRQGDRRESEETV